MPSAPIRPTNGVANDSHPKTELDFDDEDGGSPDRKGRSDAPPRQLSSPSEDDDRRSSLTWWTMLDRALMTRPDRPSSANIDELRHRRTGDALNDLFPPVTPPAQHSRTTRRTPGCPRPLSPATSRTKCHRAAPVSLPRVIEPRASAIAAAAHLRANSSSPSFCRDRRHFDNDSGLWIPLRTPSKLPGERPASAIIRVCLQRQPHGTGHISSRRRSKCRW